jgi:hypothetical protein
VECVGKVKGVLRMRYDVGGRFQTLDNERSDSSLEKVALSSVSQRLFGARKVFLLTSDSEQVCLRGKVPGTK